jgi:hypothetical protein
MAYDLQTAVALDQLLEQGFTLEQAFVQLNIPPADQSSYQLSDTGGFVVPPDPVLLRQPPEVDEDEGDETVEVIDVGDPTLQFAPDPVDDPDAAFADEDEGEGEGDETAADIEDAEQGAAMAALARAQQQATIQQRYDQTTQGDWRVRIRLLPGADYLYRDTSNQLLAPLRASDGVIFPYVPTVNTSYVANYAKYDLTHSNYRGYFYTNSAVNEIAINGVFTAQDTQEALYLLAVIHFFRSITRMFYGKDLKRGTPPPMVELSGFGEYQFNRHPCLISAFNYDLPNGVDYIRVNPSNQGLSLAPRQSLSNTNFTMIEEIRRSTLGLFPGATGPSRDLGVVNQTVSGTGQTTYVPTKMEIKITLYPVQTRQQVSQQFSLRQFANGSLLRGGFW